jgi:hypothetical protein
MEIFKDRKEHLALNLKRVASLVIDNGVLLKKDKGKPKIAKINFLKQAE